MSDKFKAFLWLAAVGCSVFLVLVVNTQANEVVTNETIKETIGETVAFRKSHSVMTDNQNRLHSLLNAFLIGDLDSVKTLASEISNSLSRVIAFLPEDDSELQTEGWQAIAEVSNQAKEIEKSVGEEDFVGAYNHYAQLSFQCIKCHQTSRSWGKFPVSKPKKPEAKPPEIESKDKSAPGRT